MKKISYLLSVIGLGIFAQAQDSIQATNIENVSTESNSNSFNKWSIEANGGAVKARKAFAPGYYSETPSFFHADFGVRYMFNNKFGLKLDGAYDRIKEGEGVARFRSNYYRVDLQGVVNVGRVLNFETWTNRIGLMQSAPGSMEGSLTKRSSRFLQTLPSTETSHLGCSER